MEQMPDAETRFCVAWRTKLLPFDRPASSPPFHFQNSQWHLQLRECGRHLSGNYELTLHAPDGARPGTDFRITTLLERGGGADDSVPLVCSARTVRGARLTLWKFKINVFPSDPNFCHVPGMTRGAQFRVVCLLQCRLTWRPSPRTSERPIDLLTKNNSDPLAAVDIPPDLRSLSLDMSNLLTREEFPDVQLQCGGRTISAHRAVLAARSGVFAAMFRNKMVESETGVVDVSDLDAQVLELLLRYVYSGKIHSLRKDLVPCLYAAADKYAVHALKKACSRGMTASLTEDNCVLFLAIADAHGDAAFKRAVVSFICGHEAILQGEVWLGFSDRCPRLANEVYQSFVTSKSKIRQRASP